MFICRFMNLGARQISLSGIFSVFDAVLTTHHMFMHTFSNTSAVKIIENHLGVAYIENQGVNQPQQPTAIANKRNDWCETVKQTRCVTICPAGVGTSTFLPTGPSNGSSRGIPTSGTSSSCSTDLLASRRFLT